MNNIFEKIELKKEYKIINIVSGLTMVSFVLTVWVVLTSKEYIYFVDIIMLLFVIYATIIKKYLRTATIMILVEYTISRLLGFNNTKGWTFVGVLIGTCIFLYFYIKGVKAAYAIHKYRTAYNENDYSELD